MYLNEGGVMNVMNTPSKLRPFCFVIICLFCHLSVAKKAEEKPWINNNIASKEAVAAELLRLETSGYRVSSVTGEHCRHQSLYKYIKSRAPFTVSEETGKRTIVLAKLPKVTNIETDLKDSTKLWLHFSTVEGGKDKLSFSRNSPRIIPMAGLAQIIDPAEKVYVLRECLEQK